MTRDAKIFVAGHRGLVGSAIHRRLLADGYRHVITRAHAELDLTDNNRVADFFARERPDFVFLAAAKVGGIHANNTYPAEFIYQNLMIESTVIHQSHVHGVKRLLFLGSSCIYPKLAPQPMREEHLMTGPLEPTNAPYATAKIAGIEMCWSYNRQYGTAFIPVMPTNLYGPHDNYDLETSHVLPAMIRKFHLAKLTAAGDHAAIARDEAAHGPIPAAVKAALPEVILWGTGAPLREFLFVDDLADACVFLMNQPDAVLSEHLPSPLFNIGVGADLTIRELAGIVARVVGFGGRITFDPAMPDGTPRKLLDTTRMQALGWRARTPLEEGIARAYEDYKARYRV